MLLHTVRSGSDVYLALDGAVVRFGAGNVTTPTVTGSNAVSDGARLVYTTHPSGISVNVCRATLPDGNPDATFGKAGCTELPVSYLAGALGVQPLPGGGYVAVLNPNCSSGCPVGEDGFMLVRLDAAGAVVTSFGTAGVSFPNVAKSARAISFGMQSTGALVVNVNASFALSLVRVTTEGTVDPSFGSAGSVSDTGGGAMVVLPNDAIVLASSYNGIYDVERFTKDGAADATFAKAGRFDLALLRHPTASAHEQAVGLLADASGRLYVTGQGVSNEAFSTPFVARLTKDGAVDPTFGASGVVTAFGAAAAADTTATGLGEDASGHLLVGLQRPNESGNVIVLTP